jgi:hypothetical protein
MNETIRVELEKALSGEMAGIVKQRLDDADRLESELVEVRKKKESWESASREHEKQLAVFKGRESEIKAKESANATKEAELVKEADELHNRRHEIATAELRCDMADAHAKDFRGVIAEICAGPVLQRQYTRALNEDIPVPDGAGYHNMATHSKQESITETTANGPDQGKSDKS